MNRMLSALGATFAVMLLALSPASANPYYYSELLCLEVFADSGYVTIQKPSGNLVGLLRTDGPKLEAGVKVTCTITCDNAPPAPRLEVSTDIGKCGETNQNGVVYINAPGLGDFGPGKAVPFCRAPIVHVFDRTIECVSGYPTPL
jgi:hypothetical protein